MPKKPTKSKREVCPSCGTPITYNDTSFGGRLGNAMGEAGMNRADLAKKLGYKRTTQISRFLNGNAVPKTIAEYETLAKAVGSTAVWLAFGEVAGGSIPESNDESTPKS